MEEQGRQQQPGQQPPQEQQPRPTSAGEPAAGSAAATAARRGLPIGLTVERGHDGGPPRLEAHFHRLRYPRLGRAFSPLRLPEQTRIVLQELDFRLLRRGSIHFQLQPQAGRHRLPLTAGEPFTVEVAPGTVVHGLVRLGSVPGGGGGDAARTATPEGLPGAGMGRAASPAQLPAPPLAGPREREPAVAARTSRETIVEEVELRFDPPLLLPNVLTTFVEVQHLFEDRRLAELLQRASALPGVQTARVVGTVAREMGGRAASFLRRRLEERFGSRLQTLLGDHLGEIEQMLGETLSDVVAGESAVVLLGRVLARSRWQPQRRQWELELAFSGQVRWFDRVSNPFEDVVLPAAVLPVPQASLDRLCSLEPLASGGFFSQRFAVLPLLQVLCAAFADVRGRLSLELDLPLLQGSGMAVDRTRLETLVRLPEHLLVNGEFLLSREDAAARPAQGAPRTDAASVDGAAPAATRLCFDLPGLSLGFAGHPEQRLEVAARASAALDLEPGERSWRRRVQAALTLQLLPGCSLPRLDLELRSTHPFARGGTCYRVLLEQLRPEGGLELAWDHHRLTIRPAGAGLRCSCRLGLPEQVFLQRGETCSSGRLQDGEFELLLQPLAENSWKASLRGRATLHHRLLARVAPIAELNIEDSLLHTHVDCVVELDGSMIARFRGPVLPDISFCRGGMLQLTLQRAEAELDGRLLTLPAGTLLTGTVHQGELAPTGPGDFALDLAWDLFGKPVLLHGRPLPDGSRSTASLLTHGLRQGELTLQVSPGGRFSFSGKREGLYGVRFFNSLLNPATDPGHLLKILSDDDALAHIVATLELFNPELTDLLSSLRELILGARTILRRENVRQPADLIPRAKISRMLSLMLVGTDELASRFSPIIQ
ncbi:MAG: hypothetical protein FJ125_07460, partial [Deltaproteobacteria bacterium]|nr:hypothetical protein [Deltaproteobacteria bacterium]